MKKTALLTTVFLLALLTLSQEAGAITVDSQGNVIVSRKAGQVLSKGSDGGDGSSGSGSSGSDSSGSDSSGGSGDTKTEVTTSDGTVVRTEVKDDGEVRTETRFSDGIRVKTREEDDRTRTDIYEGGTKLRLERRDGRVIIKLENEAGEELELPEGAEDEIFKIEEREDKNQVRLTSSGNKFIVSRGQVGAQTDFPVTVDLNTNELTISTPAGVKVVTILPDQAVANMLAANVIDRVRGLAFTQDVINLTSGREGILVYEIPGVSSKRFLGFIPVEIQKTAVVSAETGELMETNSSLSSRLLDVLAF